MVLDASITDSLVTLATHIIRDLGLAGVAVMTLCSGVIGVPGTEPTMLFAGFDVFQGHLSLLGIIASVIVGYAFYRLMIDSAFSLNLKFANYGALLGIIFAVVWFYGWKAYRKRQGVNLDRRYQEIPIE